MKNNINIESLEGIMLWKFSFFFDEYNLFYLFNGWDVLVSQRNAYLLGIVITNAQFIAKNIN